MTETPAPPVPPECVLRGHDYFPLYFDRLRKSKWWRRASDTARARNVMLWGEAYKSQPAGSLADDDDELAEAAGFGMDVDTFLAAKAEIMAPWMLCSDGRWYHPTICEVVLEVWEKASAKRRDDARRKRDQRDRTRGVTAKSVDVTRDTPEPERDTTSETGLSATIEEKRRDSDANASVPTAVGSPAPDRDRIKQVAEEVWALQPVLGGKRRATRPDVAKALAAAIKRGGDPADILASCKAYYALPDCTKDGGQYAKGADALIAADRWREYRPTVSATTAAPARIWNGPAHIRDALVKAMGEAWVRGWIDAWTRYQDVPAKALIAANAFALERISREPQVVAILRAHGIELRKAEDAA